MKKILSALVLVVVLAGMVFATGITITPYDMDMGSTDMKNAEVCIFNSGGPVVGAPVSIELQCQDVDASGDCLDAVDILSPAYFVVTTVDAVTDGTGCATLQIQTTNAPQGKYAYHVNGAKVLVEIGTVSIPEFTTIGAGLALLGAGAVYFARKRK